MFAIPKLLFDFHNDQNTCKLFTNPKEVFSTYCFNEVKDLLNKIDQRLKDGYYVAGLISYEAAYALLNIHSTRTSSFPLVWFGVFSEPNHCEFSSMDPHLFSPKEENSPTSLSLTWEIQETKEKYIRNVKSILNKIDAKEFEQLNYTVPFYTPFNTHSYSYYNQLKQRQEAEYNAFFQLEKWDILSISPELFFHVKDSTITAKPMKGTMERGKSYKEDLQLKQDLQQSRKNRLENDLTTKLMKNELESFATNVTVKDQYAVATYPTVHQMTSTLTGEIKSDFSPVQILKTLFPAVSITGVPKVKSIQEIATLEQSNRGIYCGAIGYFTPNQEAIFNVAIRTITINKKEQTAFYHAGGAITKDSKPEEEFKEVLTKAHFLHTKPISFQLLETIRLTEGNLFLLENHLSRLKQSAQYFNFSINTTKIEKELNQLQQKYKDGQWRVRLLLNKTGSFSLEINPLLNITSNKVFLAERPIQRDEIFHYHKTTYREIYENHRKKLQEKEDLFDILLWNEDGEITEFTIGNVVVELDGSYYTPPIKSGLLPGTFRKQLLQDAIIKERIITIDDLRHCDSLWFINSVRKWIQVVLVNQSLE